jgi:AraC-like DNA-binding protein
MAEDGLPRLHLVSSEFPVNERFERWQEGLAGTFNVSVPDGGRAADCVYDVSIWQFGTMLLSDSAFSARSQSRTLKNARGDQVDHYRLILQTEGELRLDTGGRCHKVEARDLVLSDMSCSEGYETTSGSNIVLFIPREMLDEALPLSFDLHLSESDLSADTLCAFFKVSRSTLYRLFEPLGGVSHYLRERRLARIHTLLSSSSQRQYLGRVAEDHGFKSTTHFSRAFREQYGYSPNEVRRRGMGPMAEGAVSEARGAAFDKWLRSLRH